MSPALFPFGRPPLVLVMASMVLLTCRSPVFAQSGGDYIDYSVAGLPGRLYVPPGEANSGTPRPLVLALHGGGGIGTDNTRHLIDFDGLLADAKTRGVFVYAPQATSAFWQNANRPELVLSMIDQAIATYNIDPARIYITGFSMGGGGAWNLYSRFADRFAAAVPIASINPGQGYSAANVAGKPAWTFHARDDSVVGVTSTRAIVDGILTAAAQPLPGYPATTNFTTTFEHRNETIPLSYTEWPTGNHSIWLRVYQNKEVLDWMYGQSLGVAPPGISQHPVGATVPPGGSITFAVVAESGEPPTFQWLKNGDPVDGANDPTFELTNLAENADGTYTVVVSNSGGSVTSRPATLLVAEPVPGNLISLSARGLAGGENGPMIAGFLVIGGHNSILIRGIGPPLEAFGVSGAMPDPVLDLHGSVGGNDAVLASNDDWGATALIGEASRSVGAFALQDANSTDAALIATVDGLGSVHAYDASGTAGVVLLELYDLDPGGPSRFSGLSARNYVGTNHGLLIAGFAIGGNVPKRLIVRGVGPGLEELGVSDVLPDPQLSIFSRTNGVDLLVASNDDWETEISAEEVAASVPGLFSLASGSRDALVALTLPAGIYTAVLSDANGATGNGLIEVYESR